MSAEAMPVDDFRILIVDDNATIHEDFRKVLGPDSAAEASLSQVEELLFGDKPPARAPAARYSLDFALQGEQAALCVERAVADGLPYAIAFVDMRMPPGWDGLETIEHLWARDPDIHVVICSAHSDYDWREVVDRLGPSDKLIVLKKPFEPIELLQCASALSRKWQHGRALRSHVESLEEIIAARTEKLEAANRQLRHLATHDALTNLPNRVLLDDRLAQAIARADRDSQPFAVMMLDLDRFKTINDSLGHRAGDVVLKEVSRRLLGLVRNTDTVARVGGDEFLLVISEAAKHEEVELVGRRINEALRAPIRSGGMDHHVTSSIGLAYYPKDAQTAEQLLAHADAAMYCAKQRGRNVLQSFASSMNAAAWEHVNLQSDLHGALALGQLELHYQAKVDTDTGDIRGAEALLRWRHPQRGLILAGDFVPLAEDCGLIDSIGAWVLREACLQCAAWQRAGVPALRIAVNVSASQFRRGNLLQTVRDALAEAHLAPSYLEIELTESVVMTDPEDSASILEELSRMGVTVSVDDFGTGYSSMSYLRRFPIDKLKIDRAFVEDLTKDSDNASIVQAIISLAHGLRLKAVAEGVETPEQLALLRTLGCDQYQGFHFSPPLPPAEFARLVQEWEHAEDANSRDEAERTHSKLAMPGYGR